MMRQKLWSAGLVFLMAMLILGSPGRGVRAFEKPKNTEKSSRVIVIFVDMSGSANKARRTVYKEAFEMIYQHLDQGDRVVVGTITGRSYIDFRAAVNEEIPEKSIWVNRLQFENNLTKTKNKIRQEVERLLSRKRGTMQTEILNSLNIADSIFHGEENRRKILVILSDMIQDSKEYKFDRDDITSRYISQTIRVRQQNNLIPKLNGVKVYVAGATAADPGKFRSIQNFWARYFDESGADFSPHRYGHSLIEFEKKVVTRIFHEN